VNEYGRVNGDRIVAASSTVVARLDRAIQYAAASRFIAAAPAYWIPRFRGVRRSVSVSSAVRRRYHYPMTPPPIRHPVRILGIDPGLRRTGWGVIEVDGNRLVFIGCGSVEPSDSLPLASRLLAIHEGLAAVLGDFKPAEAAVEQTFVNKDGVATLKLGQARGVAMLAPAMFGISVAEYAPNQVKKTVVGAGHADKNQILVMLKILLPKAEPKSADAADALAIAITHAHHRGSAALRLRVVGV
jgi:crossover junction endodeoxyribonuclease RuvC